MSRYNTVLARKWVDDKHRRLSDAGRVLWDYLLTGPEVTALPGLVVVGRAAIAEALGWSPGKVDATFRELGDMAHVDWSARVVFLPKAAKNRPPLSPNMVQSWVAHFDMVPECPLKWAGLQALRDAQEGWSPGCRDKFVKCFPESLVSPPQPLVGYPSQPLVESPTKPVVPTLSLNLSLSQSLNKLLSSPTASTSKPVEAKSETPSERDEDEVFDYLQRHTGRKPRKLTSKERERVRARLAEGKTVQDLKRCVDGLMLDPWHTTNRKLSVAYAFRNAGKVEDFIAIAEQAAVTDVATGKRKLKTDEELKAAWEAEHGGSHATH